MINTVEIRIKLPQALVERAEAVGVSIEDQEAVFAGAIEKEIERREAGQELFNIAQKLRSSNTRPSLEDIEAEIRAAREEHPID